MPIPEEESNSNLQQLFCNKLYIKLFRNDYVLQMLYSLLKSLKYQKEVAHHSLFFIFIYYPVL